MTSELAVLVIENESFLGRIVSYVLGEAGYQVSRVQSPEDVAATLASTNANVVVFHTTQRAADKSAFIESWHDLFPATKILEISDEPILPSVYREAFASLGGDASITTPFDTHFVPQLVAQVLANQAGRGLLEPSRMPVVSA